MCSATSGRLPRVELPKTERRLATSIGLFGNASTSSSAAGTGTKPWFSCRGHSPVKGASPLKRVTLVKETRYCCSCNLFQERPCEVGDARGRFGRPIPAPICPLGRLSEAGLAPYCKRQHGAPLQRPTWLKVAKATMRLASTFEDCECNFCNVGKPLSWRTVTQKREAARRVCEQARRGAVWPGCPNHDGDHGAADWQPQEITS